MTASPVELLRFRVSAPLWAKFITHMMFACIGTTYWYCVAQTHCPVFLPMISDTWVYPPANYLSRICVSLAGFGQSAVFVTLYFYHKNKFPKHPICMKATLFVSLFASFNLGVIGSVCEKATVPSCQGNNKVHLFAAMTFFSWSTAYAVIVSLIDERAFHTRKVQIACVLASVAAKLRFVLPASLLVQNPDEVAFFPYVQIFEWADVFCLLTFFAVFCAEHVPHYYFGLIRVHPGIQPRGQSDLTVLISWSGRTLATLTIIMNIFTIASTFVLSTSDGTIHPWQSWPAMSDMWVSPPSNMISRYMVCLGSVVAFITQVAHYFVTSPYRAQMLNLSLHSMTWVGLVGLMFVGACNEDEDPTVHDAGASAFFTLHCGYFVLDAMWSPSASNSKVETLKKSLQLFGLLLVLLSWWMVLKPMLGDPKGHWLGPTQVGDHSVLHLLEWAVWAGFLFSLRSSMRELPGAGEVRLAFFRKEESMEEKSSSLFYA